MSGFLPTSKCGRCGYEGTGLIIKPANPPEEPRCYSVETCDARVRASAAHMKPETADDRVKKLLLIADELLTTTRASPGDWSTETKERGGLGLHPRRGRVAPEPMGLGRRLRASGVTIAEFLRSHLTHKGWTQRELALRSDLSQKHISYLLAGKARITVDVALRFELVFGVDAKEWLSAQIAVDLIAARQKRTAG